GDRSGRFGGDVQRHLAALHRILSAQHRGTAVVAFDRLYAVAGETCSRPEVLHPLTPLLTDPRPFEPMRADPPSQLVCRVMKWLRAVRLRIAGSALSGMARSMAELILAQRRLHVCGAPS